DGWIGATCADRDRAVADRCGVCRIEVGVVIVPGQRMPIVIAVKPVDFRRGHDGLAATVQNELGLDPFSGLTVVFRSRRGDRIKILVWDGTGLVMIYKRLEDSKFCWPGISDGTMRLSRAQ